MRGNSRAEAVARYLASPGGHGTSDLVAEQLTTLPLEAFGLPDTPSDRQLHDVRTTLERMHARRLQGALAEQRRLLLDWDEISGVRARPGGRVSEKEAG